MASTFESLKSGVTEEFVRVDGVLTPLLKLGQFKDGSHNTDHKVMMLIIPGNPGIPHFYIDFMEKLYNETGGGVPVWTLGHACHMRPPGETLKITDICWTQKDVCGLDAQIAHKVKFIHENIPSDVSLILIGHSIGCYMILNMLNHLRKHTVLRCFMLFPTIERMAVSPNGIRMTPVFCYLRWIVVLLALIFSFLPSKFRYNFIYWWYRDAGHPRCVQDAIVETLTPWSANFTTFLAKIEMKRVTDLQKDLVQKHLGKLSLYYGASDHWAPKKYYYDLMKDFPQADARLCDLGLKHAFVVDAQGGQEMAKIIWLWVQMKCSDQFSYFMNGSNDKKCL